MRHNQHDKTSKDSGFTLIEVLVALAVFSLAVIALLNAQNASLLTLSAIDNRAYAEIVAENEMVSTISTDLDIPLGFTTGEVTLANRTYAWQRGVFDGGLPGLKRIELSVSLKGDEQILYSLTALKGETS